jgi:hypothetical protein
VGWGRSGSCPPSCSPGPGPGVHKPELLMVVTVGFLGTMVDSAQAFAGVFVFESGYWSYWVVPFWLTVMWMQFATLFHFALRWLSGHYLLAAVLGALGGPAAFWTGSGLGVSSSPWESGTASRSLQQCGSWSCPFLSSWLTVSDR